jgi:hypothetical protein
MKKVFYEKVGKRYEPVREYDDTFMSAFPKGTHLVVCRPGTTSYMYDIDPAFAPMLAASKYAEDEMARVVVDAMGVKPKQTPLTEHQRELWQELKKSFDEQDFVLYGLAAYDVARAGTKALEQEVEKMLDIPAVRAAYDHFMLVWKLTKEQQQE